MGGLIDLNTTNNEEEDEDQNDSNYHNYSVAVAVASQQVMNSVSSVCMELWHACAGPLVSLPKRGSVVVYLPQAHQLFEHEHFAHSSFHGTASSSSDSILSPHVFCTVLDVKLHAEAGTDEVYAQVSLIPESRIPDKIGEHSMDGLGGEVDEDDNDGESVRSKAPHMFCKTLTASDTSTHGGFSVPRRAAEDCFPPLDYNLQRPSQELVAKDLHGLEWRFRHIYRGQPRRHLLTTGWSAFVNKKKLVSGDAVLFLRGANGELRLGIRRTAQAKTDGSSTIPSSLREQMNHSNLKAALHAISSGSAFNIFYNPRLSLSEFIIPLRRFLRSLDLPYTIGMRFKTRFETEDSSQRRFTGVVTGITETDPIMWPGSKWKCLLVGWDDKETSRHSRVSPWEIEPTSPVSIPYTSSSNNMIPSGLKRSKIGTHLCSPDYPILEGLQVSSHREIRPRKVLQGQEITGFSATHNSNCHSKNPVHHRSVPASRNCFVKGAIGYGEVVRSHEVLQGQEIHHVLSSNPNNTQHHIMRNRKNGNDIIEGIKVQSSRHNTVDWSNILRVNNQDRNQLPYPNPTSQSIRQASSPSSVLMFQQSSTYPTGSNQGTYNPLKLINGRNLTLEGLLSLDLGHQYAACQHRQGEEEYMVNVIPPENRDNSRLFGFCLTEGANQGGPYKEGGDCNADKITELTFMV